MNLKERAKKLKTDIPAVFIALKKKETPIFAKIMAAITVVYALSPIDFIPILGYLDDVILLPAFVAFTIKLIPDEVFTQCQKESGGLWAGGKPKKWYYAIPIALVWLLLIFIIIKAIWF